MSTLWTGAALPWGPAARSVLGSKDDLDVLRSSVLWILFTRPGERVMRRDFGSPLMDLVFDPNDATLIAQLRSAVRTAIQRWDDRIKLVDFTTERDGVKLHCSVVVSNALDPTDDRLAVVGFDVTPSGLANITVS